MNLSDEKMAEISEPYIGREISGAELSKLLAKLTVYAHSHGYPVAAAYVPAQTASEGRLALDILPGRLGKIALQNESRLSDDVAKGILSRLTEKEILRTKALESALYLLDELSGVHAAATLSSGAETGAPEARR
ncbi:MAG: hypothetical protein IJ741_10755 [Schwartzia sp.]|nr:hypothetical protein [Schwartzia sp. (in: firmicutes)]